jgi:hypothetical protein
VTYLDYIVFFEKLDQRQAFSGNATRLYLKLLALANAIGWPDEFAKSDPYMAGVCGFSINTMKDCRAQLVARGLLNITSGGTGRNAATTYQLIGVRKASNSDTLPNINPSNSDGFTAEVKEKESSFDGFSILNPSNSDRFTAENQLNQSENPSNFDTLYIDKENNTSSAASAAESGASVEKKAAGKKHKKAGTTLADIEALDLPHGGAAFSEAWRTFYTTNTKQAGKPLTAFELMLKKLGKYPEGFAVAMLEAAIQGNWSGVENPGTARALTEWQAEQARLPSTRLTAALPTTGPPISLELELNEEFEAQQRARAQAEADERARQFRATYAN